MRLALRFRGQLSATVYRSTAEQLCRPLNRPAGARSNAEHHNLRRCLFCTATRATAETHDDGVTPVTRLETVQTSVESLCNAFGTQRAVESGRLYIVSTPIGNLQDITVRALRVLRDVDAVLAEDTRHTRALLNHYGLRTACVSLHAHNEHARTEYVVARLAAGQALALVSDAGTPGVSDPGAVLVAAVIAAGHTVTPIPGASALLTALVVSGLPTHAFTFIGFLPAQPSARRKRLRALASQSDATMAFYMPPHKASATLSDMASILGEHRRCCVAREMTKIYEELWRGTLGDAAHEFSDSDRARGEFTLLIEGGPLAGDDEQMDADGQDVSPGGMASEDARVEAQLRERLDAGIAPSRAAREVAEALGVRRRDVYSRALAMADTTQQTSTE